MSGFKSCASTFCMAIVLLLMGCSSGIEEPALGLVTGKVTVDGAPAAELLVTFEPTGSGEAVETGASSMAMTGPDGTYELNYKGTEKGAVIGPHLVRVTSGAGGGEAGGETAAPPINIPAKYNTQSTLTTEVKEGSNQLDIDITSN